MGFFFYSRFSFIYQRCSKFFTTGSNSKTITCYSEFRSFSMFWTRIPFNTRFNVGIIDTTHNYIFSTTQI
nr:MAG TPA: hypothetical protein [Caudoviricetes sp.]